MSDFITIYSFPGFSKLNARVLSSVPFYQTCYFRASDDATAYGKMLFPTAKHVFLNAANTTFAFDRP